MIKTSETVAVSNRIQSIDIVRGLIMVIMALDHVREFFSYTSFRATDVSQTSVFLFFTRWITHLCAPTFVFLSGISIYLYFTKAPDLKKTSAFLATRGLWLIVVEVFIISFILTQGYQLTLLEVIWTIGCSMILLAVLIWLPRSIQLALSLVMIVGHNALPQIGEVTPGNVVLAFLHNAPFFIANPPVLVAYTIIPWVGVMLLGYLTGSWFVNQPADVDTYFLRTGVLALVVFIALRYLNIYGDPSPWSFQDRGSIYSVLSFFNVTKSPPSPLFVTVTLGIACLFFVSVKRLPTRIKSFFTIYGRVPFFFFILHLAVISATSFIWTYLSYGKGFNLSFTMVKDWPRGYEPSLLRTYLIWLALIIVLYYPCRLYGHYKFKSKARWLSYL